MAKLIFNYPFMQREYILTKVETTVGRMAHNDLAIPDYAIFQKLPGELQRQLYSTLTKVSRRHARITFKENAFFLEDVGTGNIGSSYGTYVDGVRIETGKPYPLKSGVKIRFGPIECTFEEDGGRS